MAIVQISRIQHRRGLQQDLPQLASAELGWSLDTRKLYIGNGLLEEGAVSEGVTEILTQYTNFIELIRTYTFKGTESGYTSVTGAEPGNPVVRTLQNRLDESVSVQDFGAIGNGITDDTVAINRAIRQIYLSTLNATNSAVRRIVFFPAGTYRISSNIVVPPNCTLQGEGKNNSIIQSNVAVIQTGDSLYQIAGELGLNGAQMPSNITIRDLSMTTSSTTVPAALLVSASGVSFHGVNFSGGSFNLSVTGSSANIEVASSTLHGSTSGAINIADSVSGMVSRSNFFDTVRVPLSIGNNTVTTLANGAGRIDYQITTGNNHRMGAVTYNRSSGVAQFEDEFSEPTTGLGANLWIRSNGAMICSVDNFSTLKYNIKQFI